MAGNYELGVPVPQTFYSGFSTAALNGDFIPGTEYVDFYRTTSATPAIRLAVGPYVNVIAIIHDVITARKSDGTAGASFWKKVTARWDGASVATLVGAVQDVDPPVADGGFAPTATLQKEAVLGVDVVDAVLTGLAATTIDWYLYATVHAYYNIA